MNTLKVGDKIELRDDLEDGKHYGGFIYSPAFLDIGIISELIERCFVFKLKKSTFWNPTEMISKVNNRKVKFVDGFEYTIMEENKMPELQNKDLIFIDGKRIGVVADNLVIWLKEAEDNIMNLSIIKLNIALEIYDSVKIYREVTPCIFNANKILNDSAFEYNIIFEYKKSKKMVKEMTMEEVNKALGYKVKIVEG